LEPEAASLYCKYLTIPKPKDGKAESKVLSLFEPGARYMVVDTGGIYVYLLIRDFTCRRQLTLDVVFYALGHIVIEPSVRRYKPRGTCVTWRIKGYSKFSLILFIPFLLVRLF
jgi:hypothetical protein